MDVWYRPIRLVQEEEASDVENVLSDEDESDGPMFNVKERVPYQGQWYTVDEVHDDEGDYSYTLRSTGAAGPIRVTEEELESEWEHKFNEGDWVVYDGTTMCIKGLDWTNKKYLIAPVLTCDEPDSEEPPFPVDEVNLKPHEDLEAYALDQRVVYNWELCTIVGIDNISRTYALEGEMWRKRTWNPGASKWKLTALFCAGKLQKRLKKAKSVKAFPSKSRSHA